MDPRSFQLRARSAATKSTTVSLDEYAQLALAFARRAISENDRLMPMPGVVIRRALAVYAEHLAELMADPADQWAPLKWRAECQRITECAKGRRVDRMAWARVAEALESDAAIKPLRALLRDPDAPPLSEAVLALGREPLPPPNKPTRRCRRHPSRAAAPTLPSRATEDPRPKDLDE